MFSLVKKSPLWFHGGLFFARLFLLHSDLQIQFSLLMFFVLFKYQIVRGNAALEFVFYSDVKMLTY